MRSRSRSGFTLIELMVVMALTLFIMVILAEAFALSMDTFSGMKGIGDMQMNLRTAENLLRDDLSQAHFEGARRLSDVNNGLQHMVVVQPPLEGFFAARQSSAPVAAPATGGYVVEGLDASGMPSYRAVDQFLYFSVRRKGNRRDSFFTTSLNGPPAVLGAFYTPMSAYNMNPATDLPAATFTPAYQAGASTGFYGSQWAEVVYYLLPTGSTEEASVVGGAGTPLFSLYRAQFLMVPDATGLNAVPFPNATLPAFAGLACNPGPTNLTFYTPADEAVGKRVIDPATFAPAADPRFLPPITTLVLPNVIAFNVQILPVGAANVNFVDIPGGLYDTARINSGPAYTNNFGLRGVQCTFRVWDAKTRQVRQVTMIQDM